MDIWKKLLISGLQNEDISISFNDEKIIKDLILDECYKLLVSIKRIIDNDSFDDKTCFCLIEKTIHEFEKLNIHCYRHDY